MRQPEGLLKLTREYMGGILAGIGIGLLMMSWILKSGQTGLPWVAFLLFGSCFIAVGSALAWAGQRAMKK